MIDLRRAVVRIESEHERRPRRGQANPRISGQSLLRRKKLPGSMMDNPEDVARVREIKRLLDRIQQLPLVPEVPDQAAVLRPGSNTYQQPWPGHAHGSSAEPGGGGRGRRGSSISPWLFVLATALNTIVAAVLAVLITLGVVRQGSPRDGTLPKGSVAVGPRAGDFATATTPPPGNPAQLMALTRAIELEPIGSPDRPLRLQALKSARLPLQIQPEEAQQEAFILVLSGLPAKTTLSGAESGGPVRFPRSCVRLRHCARRAVGLSGRVAHWSAATRPAGSEARWPASVTA